MFLLSGNSAPRDMVPIGTSYRPLDISTYFTPVIIANDFTLNHDVIIIIVTLQDHNATGLDKVQVTLAPLNILNISRNRK